MSIAFAKDYIVTQERIKIYLKPGISDEIGYLTKGYKIPNPEKYNSEWLYIDEGKLTGYIKNSGIKEINNTKYIGENSYKPIIGFKLGLIVFGLILNKIYGKEKQKTLPVQNDYVAQDITVVYKSKSVGVAILLAAFFGPLGMLYSTINGALIMIILPIVLLFGLVSAYNSDDMVLRMILASTTIIYFLLYWFICIIWAAIAASNSTKIKKL